MSDANGKSPRRVVFATAYGPHAVSTIAFDPAEGRTDQSFKDECDINKLLARYQETGLANAAEQLDVARFADVTGVDFQSAMNMIAEANEMFMELPSEVRLKFGNNPGQFLDYVQDPVHLPQLRKWGLAIDRKGQEAVEIAPGGAAATSAG